MLNTRRLTTDVASVSDVIRPAGFCEWASRHEQTRAEAELATGFHPLWNLSAYSASPEVWCGLTVGRYYFNSNSMPKPFSIRGQTGQTLWGACETRSGIILPLHICIQSFKNDPMTFLSCITWFEWYISQVVREYFHLFSWTNISQLLLLYMCCGFCWHNGSGKHMTDQPEESSSDTGQLLLLLLSSSSSPSSSHALGCLHSSGRQLCSQVCLSACFFV